MGRDEGVRWEIQQVPEACAGHTRRSARSAPCHAVALLSSSVAPTAAGLAQSTLQVHRPSCSPALHTLCRQPWQGALQSACRPPLPPTLQSRSALQVRSEGTSGSGCAAVPPPPRWRPTPSPTGRVRLHGGGKGRRVTRVWRRRAAEWSL